MSERSLLFLHPQTKQETSHQPNSVGKFLRLDTGKESFKELGIIEREISYPGLKIFYIAESLEKKGLLTTEVFGENEQKQKIEGGQVVLLLDDGTLRILSRASGKFFKLIYQHKGETFFYEQLCAELELTDNEADAFNKESAFKRAVLVLKQKFFYDVFKFKSFRKGYYFEIGERENV